MRVVLFGATELALDVADLLIEIPEIQLVAGVHAPPVIRASYAPSGRPNLRHGDLRSWCATHGVDGHLFQDAASLRETAAEWQADLALVAGWYHLIPRPVIDLFPSGALGLHASLLPRFRGAAPLNWAILAGESETGMSLFELADGVDEGRLYGQTAVPIGPRSKIADLIAATSDAGLQLLRDCLPRIARGELEPWEQIGTPSYGLHRDPADGRIDWACPAVEIDRLIRAVGRPYAGAFTYLDDARVTIWEAEPLETDLEVWSIPGGIVRLPGISAPVVTTGAGLLAIADASYDDGTDVITTLRRSGHRRLI